MVERTGRPFVDTYVPYLLAQAAERTSSRFHLELKKGGVRETEWRVLATLADSPPMSLGTLERHVLAPQSTLSRTVDRLRRRNLVMRTNDDGTDRRVVMVSLTHEGHAVAEKLMTAALAIQNEDLAHLSPQDAARLMQLLASLFPAPG